jgi:NTE family protein
MAIVLFLQGCVSTPKNKSISNISNTSGYHFATERRKPQGDHIIALSFSGGGTRAAALSYGVLQELRDTQVDSIGERIRLLDEVDTISSVSGGSFTAAYYGLFGDDIFKNYEREFLNQSVQGILIRKLLNPFYWGRGLFSGFNRTEMAVEYYDTNIFRGKTFADIPLDKRPYIEINATDLSTGGRFSFTQGMFDAICSDINNLSVARAVTASSAVPIAFPSVVLKNHAGTCNNEQSSFVQSMKAKKTLSTEEQALVDRYASMQDVTNNPYLHLVDGGISDNLGLRAIIDRVDALGGFVKNYELSARPPKNVLLILVNAAVTPKKSFSLSPGKPSISETIEALSSTQITLFNADTIDHVKDKIEEFKSELVKNNHSVNFYFAELNFKSFSSPSAKDFFNNLPTSLELDKDQVDLIILTGRKLLRENKQYQDFLKSNNGELTVDDENLSCNRFIDTLCLW